MSTAVQTLATLTPLKMLWHWLMTKPSSVTPAVVRHQPAVYSSAGHDAACPNTLRNRANSPNLAAKHRPLRMVRVMEAGQSASQVGRMVISGRMADVCAELDRLAASEAPLH